MIKKFSEKIREGMTSGPSIVFTRKAVVDETFIRSSSNACKSIVRIDASQLYPFSMCQDLPTGLYTRWEIDTDMQKFKARHNLWEYVHVFLTGNKTRMWSWELFYIWKTEKKLIVLMWTVIVITERQCSKHWDVTATIVLVKKLVSPKQVRMLNEEIRGETWMIWDGNT